LRSRIEGRVESAREAGSQIGCGTRDRSRGVADQRVGSSGEGASKRIEQDIAAVELEHSVDHDQVIDPAADGGCAG